MTPETPESLPRAPLPGDSSEPDVAGAAEATASAVVVAAGNSTRMARDGGPQDRKPLLELAGAPLLEHTLAALDAARRVLEVILVAHADDVATFEGWCTSKPAFAKVRCVVAGGEERADSVRRGVFWCSFEVDVIAVHDGARPLVSPACIDAAIELAAERGAALVALPVRDTIKESEDGRSATRTLERAHLWAAQTPQVFDAQRFRAVLAQAADEGFGPTDDAALWERYVGPVPLLEGSPANFKVTTPEDLVLAEALLRRPDNVQGEERT